MHSCFQDTVPAGSALLLEHHMAHSCTRSLHVSAALLSWPAPSWAWCGSGECHAGAYLLVFWPCRGWALGDHHTRAHQSVLGKGHREKPHRGLQLGCQTHTGVGKTPWRVGVDPGHLFPRTQALFLFPRMNHTGPPPGQRVTLTEALPWWRKLCLDSALPTLPSCHVRM